MNINITEYPNSYAEVKLEKSESIIAEKGSFIFSDGEWDRDSKEWRSEEFLAWLYNESNAPNDVVVNDRWA